MPIYRKDYNDEDDTIVVDPRENKNKEEDKGTPAHKNEDLNWKDRYSNLRSYSQKQVNELEKKINDLEKQLTQASTSSNLPKTKEEVEAWAKKYPEPYAFVKSIIGLDLNSVTDDVSSRFNELQAKEAQAAKERAEFELEKLHPDFFTDIMNSEEFEYWLSTKSKRMQDALYEDSDPVAAGEVITLYKVETGYGSDKKPKKKNNASAAEDIPNRSNPKPNNGTKEYEFTESEIHAMTGAQYDENEDAIIKAQREGRILYDITGAAQ